MRRLTDLRVLFPVVAVVEAAYTLITLLPPALLGDATGWVLNADGQWLAKLLCVALATQAAVAWVLRKSPHPGVAVALAFYQIASGTVDWIIWLSLRDEHVFSTVAARIGVLAALAARGVAVADVLALAGLPARLLDVAGVRVTVAEYFALWRAIRRASGDPNIGIALTRAVRADHTEPLFLAVFGSATVGAAVHAVAAYKRMLSPEEVLISTDEAHGEVVVEYVWPAPEGAPPQVLVDAELAFPVEASRRATRIEELAPRRVELAATALDPGSAHEECFRCPVHCGRQRNAVVLAAGGLGRPYLTHQRPTVDSVSRDLAMSGRALQRLLQQHGTSFRRLLDDVRHQHAHGYLTATSFSDTEVAFLLGFEDPASFYRAFRGWTGMSPSEFRRRDGSEA
jgi:AraC-like DNA-binding protein